MRHPSALSLAITGLLVHLNDLGLPFRSYESKIELQRAAVSIYGGAEKCYFFTNDLMHSSVFHYYRVIMFCRLLTTASHFNGEVSSYDHVT